MSSPLISSCGKFVRLFVLICATSSSVVAQESSDKSTAPQRVQGRSGFFERLPPRPEKTTEELRAWADELRIKYSQPSEKWPEPTVESEVQWVEIGLLPEVEHPDENPFSKEKYALGRMLFFDPRLSKSGEMACASCHDPDLSWGDGRTVSFGLGRFELSRNAPSLLNAGLLETYFWDGRAESLEDQALGVLHNPHEMGSQEAIIVEQLGAEPGYRDAFAAAFKDGEVNTENVGKAIACFERTLTGGRSDFDRFLQGKQDQLSDAAIRGLDLFRREARCMNCHHGPLMTDHKFHDVGLSYYGRQYEDLGRYEVTAAKEDVGKFRTPSLRNISKTGPYMHNGLFPLAGVLRMYNAGMPTLTPKEHQTDDPLFPRKSNLLRPLGLNNQDLADLQAFLETLEEPRIRHRPPSLPGLPQRFPETAVTPQNTSQSGDDSN
ncbi:cytochrome-c peroxidase [bacterium]|nr:cytochrome-c peroxidase [bacterium]